MKICWDNIENLKLTGKRFKNVKTGTVYKYIDEGCDVCGEPFLSSGENPKTCCRECKDIKVSNHLKGMIFTEEHKKNISESRKGQPSPHKGKALHTEEQKEKWSRMRSDGRFAGENNPRYGDHRTWEELVGKERAEEWKQEVSDRFSGDGNPNTNGNHWRWKEGGKEKFDKSAKKATETKVERYGEKSPHKDLTFDEYFGKEKSEDIRNRISNTLKDHFEKNGINEEIFSRGYAGWYKGYFFRSGLELSFIFWAEENNFTVYSAEKGKFAVSYVNENNKESNYFPDFFIEETGEVIEIKTEEMCKTENVKKKINSAKEVYGELFKVITERDLKRMSALHINKDKIIELYKEDIIELPDWEKEILEV